MKIGAISDSHGNLDLVARAGELLAGEHNAQLVIHLGDDSIEADVLKEKGFSVLAVPGVYEDRYRDGSFINRRIEEFEGWRFLISHTKMSHENDSPGDLKPEEILRKREVDVLLHGHSHIPGISEEDGVLIVNPGHLKQEDKKGCPPSFAIIEASEDKLRITIMNLNSGEIMGDVEKEREGKR